MFSHECYLERTVYHSYIWLKVSIYSYKQNFPARKSTRSFALSLVPMNPSPPASPSVCDVNQGVGLNAATIVTIGLTIVVVAVRFAIRFWIIQKIGWDDWTILLALVRSVMQTK